MPFRQIEDVLISFSTTAIERRRTCDVLRFPCLMRILFHMVILIELQMVTCFGSRSRSCPTGSTTSLARSLHAPPYQPKLISQKRSDMDPNEQPSIVVRVRCRLLGSKNAQPRGIRLDHADTRSLDENKICDHCSASGTRPSTSTEKIERATLEGSSTALTEEARCLSLLVLACT